MKFLGVTLWAVFLWNQLCLLKAAQLPALRIVEGDTHDTDCFSNELGSCAISPEYTGEQFVSVRVTFKQYYKWKQNYAPSPAWKRSLLTTHEQFINKGSVYVLQWQDYNSVAPNFQRNLTVAFNGVNLCAAICDLQENVVDFGTYNWKWGKCDTIRTTDPGNVSTSLTYHEVDYQSSTSMPVYENTAYYYDIGADIGEIKGPDFDESCTSIHSRNNPQGLVVDIRHLGKSDNGEVEYSNNNYTIPPGEDLVVKFPAKECSNDMNFFGCEIQPRNFTLWVGDNNELEAAMAQLFQRYIINNDANNSTDYEERWDCAKMLRNGDGLVEMTFTSYESVDNIKGTKTERSDVITAQINHATS